MAKFCGKCGHPVTEGNLHCSNCGAPISGASLQQQNSPDNNKKKQPKKKMGKGGKIALIIVAVILVLAAIVGVVIGISVTSNPLLKSGKAIGKTFTSGNAYNVNVELTDTVKNDTLATVNADMQLVAAYKTFALTNGKASVSREFADEFYLGAEKIENGRVYLNRDSKDLAMCGDFTFNDRAYSDSENMTFAVYNQYLFALIENRIVDVGDFDSEEIDMAMEVIDEVFNLLNGETAEDRKEAVQGAVDVFEDKSGEDFEIDEEALQNYLDDLKKCFGDKKWLKENLGYEKGKDAYIFNVEAVTFLNAMLEIAEPYVDDIFGEEGVADDLRGELDDFEDEMKEDNGSFNVIVEIGVKGGSLTHISVDVLINVDGDELGYNLTVTLNKLDKDIALDFNSTKRYYDAYQKIIDEEDYI